MSTVIASPTDARSAMESRVGVESLEELLNERAALKEEMRDDEAMYGPFGMWDERRRALRGGIATELRLAAQMSGTKLSEAACEDAACAEERYVGAMDAAILGKTRLLNYQTQLFAIDARIKDREMAMRVYVAEAGLGR